MNRFLISLTLTFGLFLQDKTAGEDWALWRGPNGNGSVSNTGFFEHAEFGLQERWSMPIGSAYSSISVSEGRVLTMFADDRMDYLGAFDSETGTELWRYQIGRMYRAHDGGHDGPVSTPVADDSRVYALGPRGRLFAVAADSGEQVWSVDLQHLFGAPAPTWGFCTTPIIWGDLLIVAAGGNGKNGLIAFDKSNGQTRWRQSCGRIAYRSPLLATINNKPMVVLASDRETVGYEPRSGKPLWRYKNGVDHDKTPLAFDTNKILLQKGRGCELIQIEGDQASRIWRSNEFHGTHSVPVVSGNYLYGFTNNYLTCVETRTGKRRWRSRNPGGKAIIQIDGKLVSFGNHGDVVVVAADPEQYVEQARLNVSDAASYSSPAFANGTIFVRNLTDMVAVRAVPGSEVVQTTAKSNHRFANFINQLNQSADKQKLVQEFLDQNPELPVIENDQWAHFVYVGQADDVGIHGNMLANHEEDALTRVEGTNFFYRSYPVTPKTRWQYQFIVDFDRPIPDPRNPRRTWDDSKMSEIATTGWAMPALVKGLPDVSRGQIETFQFTSATPQFSRRIKVYRPPTNDGSNHRKPLLIVLDNGQWIDRGKLPQIIERVAAENGSIPIIAFVPRGPGAEFGGAATARFANLLADEIIPALDQKYPTLATRESRSLFAVRGAAVAAVYTALKHAQVFGHCIAVSYGRADTIRADMIDDRIPAVTENIKPKFHIAWSRYDTKRPQSFDCRVQSSRLAQQLKMNSYEVTGGEDPGGTGWTNWQILAARAMEGMVKAR